MLKWWPSYTRLRLDAHNKAGSPIIFVVIFKYRVEYFPSILQLILQINLIRLKRNSINSFNDVMKLRKIFKSPVLHMYIHDCFTSAFTTVLQASSWLCVFAWMVQTALNIVVFIQHKHEDSDDTSPLCSEDSSPIHEQDISSSTDSSSNGERY